MTAPLAKILIIEDHQPTQAELVRVLSAQGIEVMTATNGLTGLDRAHSEQPDLIISDIDMPEMDGFQMMHHLRAQRATQHIPVIICTGTQDQTTQYLTKQLGAVAYITKPLQEQSLKQLLYHVHSSIIPVPSLSSLQSIPTR